MSPPIAFHVAPGDDAPIYRQVVRQVVEGVAYGSLQAGERLPSLRELAKSLVVAPLTVKKAYDVLGADGVVETRRGLGTFVNANAVRSTQKAVERVHPIARRLATSLTSARPTRRGKDSHDLTHSRRTRYFRRLRRLYRGVRRRPEALRRARVRRRR
jgi:GntR family transcriptional regulator